MWLYRWHPKTAKQQSFDVGNFNDQTYFFWIFWVIILKWKKNDQAGFRAPPRPRLGPSTRFTSTQPDSTRFTSNLFPCLFRSRLDPRNLSSQGRRCPHPSTTSPHPIVCASSSYPSAFSFCTSCFFILLQYIHSILDSWFLIFDHPSSIIERQVPIGSEYNHQTSWRRHEIELTG